MAIILPLTVIAAGDLILTETTLGAVASENGQLYNVNRAELSCSYGRYLKYTFCPHIHRAFPYWNQLKLIGK